MIQGIAKKIILERIQAAEVITQANRIRFAIARRQAKHVALPSLKSDIEERARAAAFRAVDPPVEMRGFRSRRHNSGLFLLIGLDVRHLFCFDLRHYFF
jgi:hypothetical protein